MATIHFDITADNDDFLGKMQDVVKVMSGVKKAAEDGGMSLDKIIKEISASSVAERNEMKKTEEAVKESSRVQKKSIDSVIDSVDNVSESVEKMGMSWKNALKEASVFAGLDFSLSGLESFADKVVSIRADFQDIESTMKTFLGSEEKGAEFTQQLLDYAWYNMFDFKQLAEGSTQMIAYGNAVDEIIPRLDQLSNVATATHAPLEELIALYNKAKATGVVDSQAVQSWATKGLVIRDQLKEMGEAAGSASITFDQLNKVLDHATGEGGLFNGVMDSQLTNISASIGQLQDNLDSMYNSIGKSIEEPLRKGIDLVSEIVDNYETIARVLAEIIAVYGAYRTALIVVNALNSASLLLQKQEVRQRALNIAAIRSEATSVGLLTSAKTLWNAATIAVTNSLKAMKLALMSNPLTAATVAITALGVATYELYQNTHVEAEELTNLSKIQREHKEVLDELKEASENENLTEEEKNRLMQAFRDNFPQTAEKYNTWIELQNNLASAAREANAELAKQGGLYNEAYTTDKQRLDELRELRSFYNDTTGRKVKDNNERFQELVEKYRVDLSTAKGSIDALINSTAEAVRKSASKARELAYNEFEGSLKDMNKTQAEVALKEVNRQIKILEDTGKKAVKISGLAVPLTKEDLNKRKAVLESSIKTINDNATKDYLADSKKELDAAKKARQEIIKNRNDRTKYATEEQYQNALKEADLRISAAEDSYKKNGGDTKKGKKENSLQKQAEEREKFSELQKRQVLQASRDYEDAVRDAKQAEISALEDGNNKVLQQIEFDYKKQNDLIERQIADFKQKNIENAKALWLADPANDAARKKGATWSSTHSEEDLQKIGALDEGQLKEIGAMRLENETKYKKALKDVRDEMHANTVTYLSEFGSMQDQRLAIELDYDKKIKEANDELTRAILKSRKEASLAEFDYNTLKESIDWETVFGNLDNLPKDKLESIRKQLREMLGSGDLDVDQYKDIATQIENINVALSNTEDGFVSIIKNQLPALKERKRLTQEVADAEQAVLDAQKNRDQKQSVYDSAKNDLVSTLKDSGYASPIAITMAENPAFWMSNLEGASQDVVDAFTALISASADLEGAEKSVKNATQKEETSKSKLAKFQDDLSQKIASYTEVLNLASANINSLAEGLAELGIDTESGIGKIIGNIGGAINNGLGAMEDFMSGNYVGSAINAIKAVGSLTDALGITGESDKTYAEDMEKLTNSNKALKESIDALKNDMNDASIAESEKILQQMLSNSAEVEKNLQEQMARSAKAYRNGFIFGGEKSSNGKINSAMTAYDWQAVSKAAGQSVTSASQFWSLTSTQMADVAKYASTQYAKIKQYADDGHKDAAQYMDDYIAMGDQLNEIWEQWRTKVTSTSFSSVESDFSSMLSNMDSETSDFTDSFEEKMRNAVINSMMSNKYSEQLRKWYNDLADLAGDSNGLTQEDIAKSRAEWNEIASTALKERDTIMDVLGLDNVSMSSAKSKGFSSMSQETGNEMNGRLTAMQIDTGNISMNVAKIQNHIEMMSNSLADKSLFRDIRDLAFSSNGYLEQIAKFVKQSHALNSEKLTSIERKILEL